MKVVPKFKLQHLTPEEAKMYNLLIKYGGEFWINEHRIHPQDVEAINSLVKKGIIRKNKFPKREIPLYTINLELIIRL
jgi:hypothetical protein